MLVFDTPAPTLPCSWDVDVSCDTDDIWGQTSDALRTTAAEYGALTLWAATGRRFGLCQRTVRPCGRDWQFESNAGYFWSDGVWFPYIFDGVWRNCWCGSGISNSPGCCTCDPRCQVWLPGGPVASIPVTGVSVDGAIVPVDSWRVDSVNGEQYLVRTDGDCWPFCQDFNVDSGTGTFFVTYNQGIPVPSILLKAAGELAIEYIKSCLGKPCRLPQRIQSITRQGVSVSMVNVDNLLKQGLTGVFTVDQIIRTFNPNALTSAMRVASPDVRTPRTTIQA